MAHGNRNKINELNYMTLFLFKETMSAESEKEIFIYIFRQVLWPENELDTTNEKKKTYIFETDEMQKQCGD